VNPLTSAVLRTGLIDPDLLQEIRRWGVVFEDVPAAKPQTLEEVTNRIQEALESQDLVLVRETDLSVLDEYIKSARRGTLRVVVDDGHQGEFHVTFGRTKLGEFVLPWLSSSIADVLTNGMTHLWDEGEPVYFSQVRELFFGETKAFMICTPYPREPALPEHSS
jgi:hypothetical protein